MIRDDEALKYLDVKINNHPDNPYKSTIRILVDKLPQLHDFFFQLIEHKAINKPSQVNQGFDPFTTTWHQEVVIVIGQYEGLVKMYIVNPEPFISPFKFPNFDSYKQTEYNRFYHGDPLEIETDKGRISTNLVDLHLSWYKINHSIGFGFVALITDDKNEFVEVEKDNHENYLHPNAGLYISEKKIRELLDTFHPECQLKIEYKKEYQRYPYYIPWLKTNEDICRVCLNKNEYCYSCRQCKECFEYEKLVQAVGLYEGWGIYEYEDYLEYTLYPHTMEVCDRMCCWQYTLYLEQQSPEKLLEILDNDEELRYDKQYCYFTRLWIADKLGWQDVVNYYAAGKRTPYFDDIIWEEYGGDNQDWFDEMQGYALKLCDDQEIIKEVALSSKSVFVRQIAVALIDDEEFLKKMLNDQMNQDYRIMGIIASKLNDTDVLRSTALQGNHEITRAIAVEKIKDTDVLLNILSNDKHEFPRIAVVKFSNDLELLHLGTEDPSYEVYYIAYNRLFKEFKDQIDHQRLVMKGLEIDPRYDGAGIAFLCIDNLEDEDKLLDLALNHYNKRLRLYCIRKITNKKHLQILRLNGEQGFQQLIKDRIQEIDEDQ